jgi:protein PhnA
VAEPAGIAYPGRSMGRGNLQQGSFVGQADIWTRSQIGFQPGRYRETEEIMTDIIVKDSNGAELKDGDSVTLIKDLKVKGTSETIKRGTLVKNIRLTGKAGEIECSTKQVKGLVLKTEFLKKA